MAATTGIQTVGDYTSGPPTNKQIIQRLLALIPNPDVAPSQGGGQGTHDSYLDEMSPPAAAQLRAELAAVEAAITNV